jgi:hypothetical protein
VIFSHVLYQLSYPGEKRRKNYGRPGGPSTRAAEPASRSTPTPKAGFPWQSAGNYVPATTPTLTGRGTEWYVERS